MPSHPGPRARSRALLAAAIATFVVAAAASVGIGTGASTSTVVDVQVASAVSITNQCTSAAATNLGSVTPGIPARTATDTTACRVQFQSSNDSAMLRIGQRDGTGTAQQNTGSWSNVAGSESERSIRRVDAISSTTQVGVGRGGRFYRSIDSSVTWSVTSGLGNLNLWPWLYGIEHVPGNPSICYAVGTAATVVKIDNCASGTPTFTNLTTKLTAAGWPAGDAVHDVEVVSASTIFVVGRGGRVARSADGGATFDPSFTLTGSADLHAIDALDANTIHAGGGGTNTVFTTTTGGATAGAWQPASGTGTATVVDVETVDATTAYAVAHAGVVLMFDGTSWQNRSPANNLIPLEQMRGVAAHAGAPGTVYATARRGQLLRSTDRGVTWQRQTTGHAEDLEDVDLWGADAGIIGGDLDVIARTTTGTSWQQYGGFNDTRGWDGVAAHRTNGQVAIAAGSRGRLRRTTDGGATWTTITGPATDRALFGVAFGTGDVAWAVGDNGTILRTTDAGLNWTLQPTGVTARLWSVTATDSSRAWAVGDGGTILRTTDGGQSWQALASGTTSMLRGISAASRNGDTALVAVGRLVVRYSFDGGNSWQSPSSSPPATSLTGVSHGSANVLYASTTYQNVWKSTDGGATWTSFNAAGMDIFAVSAVDENTAFLAGSFGSIGLITGGAGPAAVTTVNGSVHHRGVAATGRHSAIIVGSLNSAARFSPAASATRVVSDYGVAPSNWAGTGSSSMFGVCLQSVSAQTTPAWTVDSSPSGAVQCEASDSDPWYAVPAAATKIASTPAAGNLGSVDLVWGMRAADDQAPGSYSATVVFEALAPNA